MILKNKFLRIFILLFALIGVIFSFVFVAMQFGWLNVRGSARERNAYFNVERKIISNDNDQEIKPTWAKSEEWQVIKEVFTRDQYIINQAANDAGIPPRLLLGGVIGEQLRFFAHSRESFKQYFEPLKVLASLSKFSFGIAGLKPDTVKKIDEHLKDTTSVFYLGPDMEHFADYPEEVDPEKIRFQRITDTKNPYYPYLYVGLFMRQVQMQWEKAGYPIDNRPEILATLFNLGFNRSIPKADAQGGGAIIILNGQSYTFGQLAYEFYYSDELSNEFPIK